MAFRDPDSGPLLLEACKSGAFGRTHSYDGGCVYEAGFLYLAGSPNEEWLAALETHWKDRMFICLSRKWRAALSERRDIFQSTMRYWMHEFMPDREKLRAYACGVPAGYRIEPFDADAFSAHPFHHGANYASYAEFARTGSGSVARFGDEIVASASSYLSFQDHVEVDVFTQEEHRRKRLGLACAAAMLLDCIQKKRTAHWDAQNPPSREMAEKLGYRLLCECEAFQVRADDGETSC